MAPSYPQIVVTGDSISQQAFNIGGYGAALVNAAKRTSSTVGWEASMSNSTPIACFSIDLSHPYLSSNSQQLLNKLKDDFQWPNGDIKLILIHIGTNDATTRGIQHLSVEDFTQNVRAILNHLKATQPAAKIILLTPSIVDVDAWAALGREQGMPSEFFENRTTEAAKRIRDAVVEVAKEADVGVLDVWKLHEDAVNNGELEFRELFSDGLHYTAKGYAYINKALLQLISTSLPSLSPDTMPEGFTMFAIYGNENNPEAQRMVRMYMEKTEADKQAALGNAQ
ncbi:hypothetical protein QFC19_000565 [Naganishia cerealis]|uniref:Uncharacterized protein n=1 Tax=Naganishia cerealis TaxID=610337 RepID=A0ACC2WMU8_9TREE|nr:hypothetical protein QFC19_000565 [Naganishia cerealis]